MYLIVDLEATCWDKDSSPERMEIIEIGAVKLSNSLEITDEYSSFVRPVNEPILSDFCKNLTSIEQEQIGSADTFPIVFERFIDWVGNLSEITLCSWGAYDKKQLIIDCRRHGVDYPFGDKHINLKKMFSDQRSIKPCGMKRALQILGLPLEGKHHRAIDDVRNIAEVAKLVLHNGTGS